MKGLPARLLEHWQLKMLSVIFAVGLWAFVTTEDRTEAVYSVPVDVEGLAPGLEVASLTAETVDVRVQGLRHVLNRLREAELRVEIDLQGVRSREVLSRIGPGNVKAPPGVRVVRVTPSRVRATLEPTKARSGTP